MPHGDNLDHDHQVAAGRQRWSKATAEDKARHLRATARGLLKRANELDPAGETFSASDDRSEE